MRSPIYVAALAAGALLSLFACVSDGQIDGHTIRASGATTVEKREITQPDIHLRAPQWFKDYWVEYIDHQRHGYAVMAMDRNLRGLHYVYCGDPQCYQLRGGQHRSWKDVQYKHRALEVCREIVREEFPAAKPACSVYAINDKIVRKGRLPWE